MTLQVLVWFRYALFFAFPCSPVFKARPEKDKLTRKLRGSVRELSFLVIHLFLHLACETSKSEQKNDQKQDGVINMEQVSRANKWMGE